MADEEPNDLLIEQVKKYPVLYDKSSLKYRDINEREAAWEMISKALKIPVDECRTKWCKLRNSLASALKRRRHKPDQVLPPWRYMDSMSFLFTHMEERRFKSNHSDYEEQYEVVIDDPLSQDTNSQTFSNRRSLTPTEGKVFLEEKTHTQTFQDLDETDYFFLTMGRQVKALKRADQARIKFELHKMIYEAEMGSLK